MSEAVYHCESCGPVPSFCARHRCEARPAGWHPLDVAAPSGPPLDILNRLDAYTSFDAETEFLFVRKLDGATVARADWVRDGEALWDVMQSARDEIIRLRAALASK